jgi:Tol biopolymer transport system component
VCTYGSPSPDGRRLVFRKVIDAPAFDWALNAIARNSEVFVADLDGGNERNLTKHAAFDGWPAWSPDGRFVVVSSNRTGRPNAGQLFAIEVDGDRVVALTDDVDAAFVQHRFAGPGTILASRSVSAPDGSWEAAQVVRLEVELPAAAAR